MNHDSSTPHTASAMSSKERLARNKETLLDALKRAGALRARVTYHGGGDEGSHDDVSASDAANSPIDLSGTVSLLCERYDREDGQWKISIVPQDQPLDTALSDYAMEAVEKHHGGWENNDGAFGEFCFDAAARSIHLEFNERFTSSELYTHDF